MLKYLLRLLGSGRLPREGLRLAEAEQCRVLVESMVGSITFRNFRAPGKRSSWRRRWFLGSLAISDKRVLVYRYGSCLVNLPLSDRRFDSLDFSTETAGVLSILHDAALFQPSWSGEIEICFQTPEAMHICSTLASNARKHAVRVGGRAPTR